MRYNYVINFEDINSQAYNIVKFIKPKSKILDIGCATGGLGKYLREQLNCYVVGIDKNPEYKNLAARNLNEFYLLDVNNFNSFENFLKNKKFDFIILADIIEHLVDTDGFLSILSKLITSEYIILSIPNITFWEVRLKIFLGIFEYEEAGIFDRTHLHFYNLYYARKILSTNFNIIGERYASWYLPSEKLLCLQKIPIVKNLTCFIRYFLASIVPNFYASQLIFLLQTK